MTRASLRSTVTVVVFVAVAGLLSADGAFAQPFYRFLSATGHPQHGYVSIPHNAALDAGANFTFEAWVKVDNNPTGEDCRSIAGKGYLSSWWVGLCDVGGKPTLRSYLTGGGSARNGGQIEPALWTHIAVVRSGANRYHYINGELAATFAEPNAPLSNTNALRIFSDVNWQFTPTGGIDEVRIWNVARSQAQLRDGMRDPITVATAGLVAVWSFDTSAADILGPHDGTITGAGIGILITPASFGCSSTATQLCLHDRFIVTSRWRTNPAPGSLTDGSGQRVAVANPGSGLFWFFSADNWEVMVKLLNGCGLNNRYWGFSAATTNVFYRLDVTDLYGVRSRIYFNYPGPPAPAVTDVNAFATCP